MSCSAANIVTKTPPSEINQSPLIKNNLSISNPSGLSNKHEKLSLDSDQVWGDLLTILKFKNQREFNSLFEAQEDQAIIPEHQQKQSINSGLKKKYFQLLKEENYAESNLSSGFKRISKTNTDQSSIKKKAFANIKSRLVQTQIKNRELILELNNLNRQKIALKQQNQLLRSENMRIKQSQGQPSSSINMNINSLREDKIPILSQAATPLKFSHLKKQVKVSSGIDLAKSISQKQFNLEKKPLQKNDSKLSQSPIVLNSPDFNQFQSIRIRAKSREYNRFKDEYRVPQRRKGVKSPA